MIAELVCACAAATAPGSGIDPMARRAPVAVVRRVEPAYPREAIGSLTDGEVRVVIASDSTGAVRRVDTGPFEQSRDESFAQPMFAADQVTLEAFERAATHAAWGWRFAGETEVEVVMAFLAPDSLAREVVFSPRGETIEGRVIERDGRRERPLRARVHLELWLDGQWARASLDARTDARGRFRVRGVPEGLPVGVHAEAPCFIGETRPVWVERGGFASPTLLLVRHEGCLVDTPESP